MVISSIRPQQPSLSLDLFLASSFHDPSNFTFQSSKYLIMRWELSELIKMRNGQRNAKFLNFCKTGFNDSNKKVDVNLLTQHITSI